MALPITGLWEGAVWDLPLGAFQPVGGTDSERFFCHLLAELDQRDGPLADVADWRWLHQTLAAANQFGKLNLLLSDGRRLFVYHDIHGWKGLNFSQTRSTDLSRNSRATERTHGNHGFVVATCPLNDADWHTFRLGELIVFESGTVRFSSHRESDSTEFASIESDPVITFG